MESSFVRSTSVAERTVAGETVLVPIRHSPEERISVLTLNAVGSLVWRELGEPRTASWLADRVAREFEVSAERAAADLEPFLDKLRALALVQAS